MPEFEAVGRVGRIRERNAHLPNWIAGSVAEFTQNDKVVVPVRGAACNFQVGGGLDRRRRRGEVFVSLSDRGKSLLALDGEEVRIRVEGEHRRG